MKQERRPPSAVILTALVALFGIVGILSGLALMISPSGALLDLPSEYLDRMPFHNFFLVGLFLFVIFGIMPLTIAFGLWTREQLWMGEISKAGGIHWAWQGAAALLGVLVIWLLVEHFVYDIALAPPTYFVMTLGVLIFLALIMPSTRRFYRTYRRGTLTSA